MRESLKSSLGPRRCATALALLLLSAVSLSAQSSDLDFPTPVVTNEIEGRIAPRDLGDPRQTSHFYTFNGTQGDLILTVEANNLDGAVDLFLAPALRPLTQVTLYAGGALSVSKTVFLRKEETLVLRVQARTPNDADGTYRIRFGGTFQPSANVAAAAPPQPETTAANKPPARGTHRVNSVGARIEEPEPEAPPKAEAKEAEASKTETAAPPRAPAPRTRPPRRTRTPTRTETARRPTTERKTEAAKTEAAKTEGEAETKPAENTETPRPETAERTPPKPETARTPRPRAGRTNRTSRTKEAAKRTSEPAKESTPSATPAESTPGEPTPVPQLGATRLIIEGKDGVKVEHEMSTVSRVTVVNQLIVVVLKNGRVERYPLTNVLRMAIEP